MTLWFVPIWLIFVSVLTVVLIGVLLMTLHEHHGLRRKVGMLTPYNEQHATDLQDRVHKIVAASAEQHATITRNLEASNDDERLRRQQDDLDRITENRKRTKGQSGD